jgi:predicted permease
MTGPEPLRPRDGVDDELRFHLESRAAELVADGMPTAAARAQALREFGDLDDARDFMTAIDNRVDKRRARSELMRELMQDMRYALRRLRAAPGFTAVAVLTLALGVGANTAIFSVVRGVLLRPLPFPEPERLYAVYSANRSADLLRGAVSPPDLDDWRAQRRSIADLGGYFYSEGSSGLDLTGRGAPRRLSTVFVAPGFFTTLGVPPLHGRLPREDELVRGGPDKVAVLSHRFWAAEFAADPSVVGRSLTLGGTPHVVIGVMPPDMRFPSPDADLYVPYSTIPDDAIPRLRQVRVLNAIARASAGTSEDGVRAEMAAIATRLAAAYPEDRHWDAATVMPLADVIVGPVRDGLLVLFGAVSLVLLIASVNVAGLQLARAMERGREIAVRLALGARRGRLVRQLLTESVVLSLLGGVAGIVVAIVALRGLMALASDQLPRAAEVSIDGVVLAFTIVVTLATGLLFGLAPALRSSRGGTSSALRTTERSVAGPGQHWLRSTLVILEVALAMMLVIGAGLMVRSFVALTTEDAGFNADGLLAVQFTIDGDRHSPPDSGPRPFGSGAPYTAYYERAIEAVRRLPGVVSAAAVKDPPFRGNGERNGFQIAGRPVPAVEDPPSATVIHVSEGYFRTIGARVDGREFAPTDRTGAPVVVVVNEAFARQYFPGERALGRRLRFGAQDVEIVGVVNDIRQVAMAEPARPTIYIHNLQNSRIKTTLVVRTTGDPMAMAAAVREAIWAIDPQQAITAVFTFDESVSRALSRPRLNTVLLGSFGVLGLALGALGLYGVLAALVNERRREIGVRLALGAAPRDVRKLVVGWGLTLAAIGIVAGGLAAAVAGRFVAAILYGVTPFDVSTFAVTAAVLTGAALAASWLPARRAAAVDPIETLRE